MLSSILPLQDDEEDVLMSSHCLQIFRQKKQSTNTIEQIYVQKKFKLICSKLIFRRLLVKLAIESTFKFNSRF